MSDSPLRLRQLFEKYARGIATEEELQHMWGLMKDYGENDMLEEDMRSWWNAGVDGNDPANRVDATKILEEVIQKERKLKQQLNQRTTRLLKNRWKWVAAAVIILVCGSTYFFLQRLDHHQPASSADVTTTLDIQAPQVNRAVIKLANGQLVYLDSTQVGMLAVQGETKINKVQDGEINYSNLEDKIQPESAEVEYNTLSNPRGSKVIAVTLSDGSRVWLNAGSSLTFPVAFSGSERMVSMSGEAYFEVQHDSKRPFRVKAGSEVIEDLGTRFNVSAYSDEPALRTTLLEGAVKLSLIKDASSRDKRKPLFLKPGQQATLNNLSSGQPEFEVKRLDDMESVIAWKSGRFRFNSIDIESVMRQAARWYDVDVIYKGNVKGTISGGLARTRNISELLKILELTGKVRFSLEGRKLTVYAIDDAR